MRLRVISVLLCAFHLPGLCDAEQLPRDIRAFAANAEACEHLGAEYDGDLPAAQRREIEQNVRKYCRAASRQLKSLRAKYRNDPVRLEAIRRHANEAVTDYPE